MMGVSYRDGILDSVRRQLSEPVQIDPQNFMAIRLFIRQGRVIFTGQAARSSDPRGVLHLLVAGESQKSSSKQATFTIMAGEDKYWLEAAERSF